MVQPLSRSHVDYLAVPADRLPVGSPLSVLAGEADLSSAVVARQALGVVMARLGVGESTAAAMIRSWASDQGQDVVSFCVSLLTTVGTGAMPTPGTSSPATLTDPVADFDLDFDLNLNLDLNLDQGTTTESGALDGLAAALVAADSPASRAQVVSSVIRELYEVMSELSRGRVVGFDTALGDELMSLRPVCVEANRHLTRMVALNLPVPSDQAGFSPRPGGGGHGTG